MSVRDPRTAVDESGPVAIDGFGFKQRDPSQNGDAWQYSERLFGAHTGYWSPYKLLLSAASRCPRADPHSPLPNGAEGAARIAPPAPFAGATSFIGD